MRKHAKKKTLNDAAPAHLPIEEQWGMSQWSHEEELLADYVELQSARTLGTPMLLAVAVALGVMSLISRSSLSKRFSEPQKDAGFMGWSAKQHLV